MTPLTILLCVLALVFAITGQDEMAYLAIGGAFGNYIAYTWAASDDGEA